MGIKKFFKKKSNPAPAPASVASDPSSAPATAAIAAFMPFIKNFSNQSNYPAISPATSPAISPATFGTTAISPVAFGTTTTAPSAPDDPVIVEPDVDPKLAEKLAAEADVIVTKYTSDFNTKFGVTDTINTFYNTELINSKNIQELYGVYTKKNIDLDGNIKEVHSDVLTNDRKTFYEMGALEVLVNWNYFLLYMYFTFFAAFVLGIIFSENTLPKYQSISLAIILFFYPFLISPIVQLLSGWVIYAGNLYPKNVYNSL